MSVGSLSLNLITFLLVFYFNNSYQEYNEQKKLLDDFKRHIIHLLLIAKNNNSDESIISNIILSYVLFNLYIFREKKEFISNYEDIVKLFNTSYINYINENIIKKNNIESLKLPLYEIITKTKNICDTKNYTLPNIYIKYTEIMLYSYLFIFNFIIVSNIDMNSVINFPYVFIVNVINVIIFNFIFIGIKIISDEIIDPFGDDSIDFIYQDYIKEVFNTINENSYEYTIGGYKLLVNSDYKVSIIKNNLYDKL